MNLFNAFAAGARQLAAPQYSEIHAKYGISQGDWDLLTLPRPWTADERRQVRSILAECLSISMHIAGLPAMAMPGQFAAALIVHVVHPCNRLVAATRAPDTYDGELATGLRGPVEVSPMRIEQMLALVIAYSGEITGEPTRTENAELQRQVAREAKK